MKEEVNSMLKCKRCKLVRKELDLEYVEGLNHKVSLELEVDNLWTIKKCLGCILGGSKG